MIPDFLPSSRYLSRHLGQKIIKLSLPSFVTLQTGTNDAIIAAAFQQHYFRQIEDANQVPGLARLERLNRRPPPRARPVRSVVDSGLGEQMACFSFR